MTKRTNRRRIGLYGVVTAALACSSLLVGASGAAAVEGQPLAFTSFNIQTTAATIETYLGGKPRGSREGEQFEFTNLPYTPAFTQAGGHPWALTTVGEFATESSAGSPHVVTRDVKDIVTTLPAGLLGNPAAVPACPLTDVASEASNSSEQCPADTQIGWYRLQDLGGKELLAPIVNVKPEHGQSAEFALENTSKILTPVLTAHLTRTGEGYAIAVVSKEIPVVNLQRFELTFWGVPANPGHDEMRGRVCRVATPGEPLKCEGGGEKAGIEAVPFLSMPTGCSMGPEQATIRADSWQEPGSVGVNGQYSGYTKATATMPGVTGCNVLRFEPGIEAVPTTLLADEPVGLGVNIDVPQPEQPRIDATPQLRDAVVTLPEGMSVSPSVVDGAQACDATGPAGINIEGPESEFVGEDGEWHLAPGRCPDASTIGEAEAITPLLNAPVKGHIYLARPGCGDAGLAACTERDAVDGNLYGLYLELGGTGELSNAGIEIKVPGRIEVNPATGQLTSKFLENPQLPFSQLRIRLNGGPRAPLDNPAACGTATTTARFTPWSAPGVTPQGLLMTGTPDATPFSTFDVGGCAQPTPFAPGFLAGTATANAGQFTAFTLNLSRRDREQYVKGIQVHTPPGMLGMLSSVPLCGQAQADEGTCPEGSKIGSTRVATGAGSHPFEIEGGVYLTGSYDGSGSSCTVGSAGCAPFGLSIVVHLDVGPYHLGLKVVRARIDVDPNDSTLTVTTDETGPYAVPQIVFGVPVRLKRVTVDIDRPSFMFNPTNCDSLAVRATVSGSQQGVAHASSPFAAGGCQSLAFAPRFTAATNGHTSRKIGASLDVKLSYPADALGSDANVARVKVSLPHQLPSRLETLQKACLAETFEANPAACPPASVVGVARALTPLLPRLAPRPCAAGSKRCPAEAPASVMGPVYFVSHGGEKFPSLVIVLQGDGVRVDLTGETFISKAGITSSTFKTVPDVPVNSFELYLPQGRYSALAANADLCAVANGTRLVARRIAVRVHGRLTRKTVRRRVKTGGLVMPTEMVAQNGRVFRQSTRIAVSGCTAIGRGARG